MREDGDFGTGCCVALFATLMFAVGVAIGVAITAEGFINPAAIKGKAK